MRSQPRPLHNYSQQRLRVEVGAGGIIYRRREGRLEFFFLRHGKGRWTFPKGHRDLGESLVETAIREIKEEVGLVNLRFVAPIGKTSFRLRKEGQLIEKNIQFFLFEASPDAKEILTGEEAIWEAIWVPVERIFETCGYMNLAKLLVKALRIISQEQRRAMGRG